MILGVGTGESLNEVPVGVTWPEQGERFARLKESVQLIQQLWRGERLAIEGQYYRTDNATIYDRPDEPVPVYIAASGPAAARLAGRIADGLHLHQRQGRGALHRDAAAGAGRGRRQGRPGRRRLDRMIEMKVSFDTDL